MNFAPLTNTIENVPCVYLTAKPSPKYPKIYLGGREKHYNDPVF
jgi:hypothetical protein